MPRCTYPTKYSSPWTILITFVGAAIVTPCFATDIDDKYAALNSASGFLGSATSQEMTAADGVGKYRHYQNGSIYYHPTTGAHEVHGLILQRWNNLSAEAGYLGYPMTDELDTADATNQDGRVSKFQGGQLIWRKATNAVTEVKCTDLVIDLPFPTNETWKVIQANAVASTDSHGGKWAYCWDFVRAEVSSNGKAIASAATSRIIHVDEHLGSGTSNPGNVIIQQLGEGRYASYLHIKKSSYTQHFGSGNGEPGFLPQAMPWQLRPTPSSGAVLAEMSDSGAPTGNYHLHFAVTTKPDRKAFAPFESVPVAFRNYSYSTDSGKTWTKVETGVPQNGHWLRREESTGKGAPKVNNSAATISFGTVKGQVKLEGPGHPSGPGTLKITVSAPWGEPLKSTTVAVPIDSPNGPWTYVLNNVPAFDDLKVNVVYSGPWSIPLNGGAVMGQTDKFMNKPNVTNTQDVLLKAKILQ